MATGKITKFILNKNFGFITPDDGTPDLYFHLNSAVQNGSKLPRIGDIVTYDLEEARRGFNAINVKRAILPKTNR
jgi:CspA family cold shock protein